jgi:hypothetical protein
MIAGYSVLCDAATLGDASPNRTQPLAVLMREQCAKAPLIVHQNGVDWEIAPVMATLCSSADDEYGVDSADTSLVVHFGSECDISPNRRS